MVCDYMKKKLFIILASIIMIIVCVVLIIVFSMHKNIETIDSTKTSEIINVEKETLDTPIISVSDDTLYIEEIKDVLYIIYIDDEEYLRTKDRTIPLNNLEVGQHSIKVKAILDGFNDSEFSSINYKRVEYQKFNNKISSLSRVGIGYSLLGSIDKKETLESNGGLSFYPTYGTNLTDTSLNSLILGENISLLSSNETYDSMDKDGNLYLGDNKVGVLYKHTSSLGLYGGNVLDEKRVIKSINIKNPREVGNYITGLYAPAGEVIKIEISSEDLLLASQIEVTIGNATGKSQSNDIPETATYNRMPKLVNKMTINKEEAYVGSYFGGPIYISSKKRVPFKVTISGAVEYLHYIDGITSKEEFERLSKTSAPYSDFEIYDSSVRFSGPRYLLDND